MIFNLLSRENSWTFIDVNVMQKFVKLIHATYLRLFWMFSQKKTVKSSFETLLEFDFTRKFVKISESTFFSFEHWFPVKFNTTEFCKYSGKLRNFTDTSFQISVKYIIARSFRGMHWNCQSQGSHFFIPRGEAPRDEEMIPEGLAISMHHEKWSCNSIST